MSKHCIICEGWVLEDGMIGFAPFVANRMFNKDLATTNLVTCQDCGFMYASVRPTEAEMRRMYSGYRGDAYTKERDKWEPGYEELAMQMTRDKSEIAKWRKDFNSRFMGPHHWEYRDCLDFGGDGEMLPDGCHGFHFDPYNDSSDRLPKSFALIYCCGVLEHVADPLQTMEQVKALNGDYHLFEVPDEGLRGPTIHEHINFFNKTSLIHLIQRAGFTPLLTGSFLVKASSHRDMMSAFCFAQRKPIGKSDFPK